MMAASFLSRNEARFSQHNNVRSILPAFKVNMIIKDMLLTLLIWLMPVSTAGKMEDDDSSSSRSSSTIESEVRKRNLDNGINVDVNVDNEKDKNNDKIVDIVRVRRRLGLPSGVALIFGTIVGSGIFISPKGVLQNTGSIGLCLVVWVACGLISICAALVYSELGILIPKTGGDYAYLLTTFGSFPAFVFVWVNTIALRPASTVIKMLTFSEYLMDAISTDGCGPPEYTRKLLAAAAILTVSITNFISVRLVARTQIIFTIVKMAGLIMIAVGGIVYMSKGTYGALPTGFSGTTNDVGTVALAFYSGLYAFGGWVTLNLVMEELKNPERNLILSIIISMVLVIILYLLVNISYFVLMSKEEFLSSWAVGFTWGEKVLGKWAVIIPIIVACSVYGSTNGSVFVAGRLLFAAGRDGNMPELVSYIHVKNQIPLIAVLINTIISLLLLIPSDVGSLLNVMGFLGWLFYGLGMICVIILRFRMKDAYRVFKIPLIVPVLILLCCIYLVVSPFIQNPRMEFLYCLGLIVLGIIVYFIFVFFRLSLPYFDKVTSCAQLLFEIEPTTKDGDQMRKSDFEKVEDETNKSIIESVTKF